MMGIISAEATWAMITVIIVVIVVIIFCCLIPFFKALEKRYHHWEDEENDPRYWLILWMINMIMIFITDGIKTSFSSPPPPHVLREVQAVATITGECGRPILTYFACFLLFNVLNICITRLSVCSGEDSSVTTSTSNINNTFKNHCLLPR